MPSHTFTATPTVTATITATEAFSYTFTPVPTMPAGVVGIYPNPVTGPIVQVMPPAYAGLENIRLEVFSLAFRKVLDHTYPNWPNGQPIPLTLTANSGNTLANGVYYVVLTLEGKRYIGKLLVLR